MPLTFRPFRKFQWQLSLSYTLVAVSAMLAVELLLIGGFIFLISQDYLPRLMTRSFRAQFGVSMRPFLTQPEPDLRGINNYLSSYLTPSVGINSGPGTQVWTTEQAQQNLVVIDPHGKVLWTEVPLPGGAVGQTLDPSRVEGLPRVLPAALANDPEASHLYTRVGTLLVMAVPIDSQDGKTVLGVMIWLLAMPSFTNPQFMVQLLPTILGSLLVFTLAAGLFGSIFGFFTARRLTHRLGTVSSAADAWSRGDFSLFIQDSTGDELGEMARRLNAMAEQLQNLMGTRQQLAALEERNRIARELHDSVKQQVFAAAMQLGAAHALLPDETGPAAQRLAEAEKLTKQAQNELTALIRELRPVALEGKGLVRALRELTADWARQAGVLAQFELDKSGQPDAPLPLLKEQALYRITQEALANVARHAAAHHVRVGYCRADGEVRLTVQDDGRGFDPSNTSTEGQGVGLRSMRERVETLHGKLEIESAPGKGTKLTVIMPEREQ